jgi:TolB protein
MTTPATTTRGVDRRLLRTAALGVVLAGFVLVACGSGAGASTPAKALGRGVEGPRCAIPWAQVGPGWSVALWGPAKPEPTGVTTPAGQLSLSTESPTLYLLDPQGGRYRITTLAPAGDHSRSLDAWSGDGRRVLIATSQTQSSDITLTEISLVSARAHSFTASDTFGGVYANPAGGSILVTSGDSFPMKLERVSTDGTAQLTYPQSFAGPGLFNGTFASSPDGAEIAMGEQGGQVALVSKSGVTLTNVPVPGATSCTPTRWWSKTEVLASCQPSGNGHPLLWLVPTSGGVPTAFTVPGPPGPDNGDQVAWQVGRGTYVQDVGGCGYVYLTKRTAAHTTSPVYVPYVNSRYSVLVLGATGGQMLVQSALACGAGNALLWFNPSTGTAHVVLGPTVNGGSVNQAILFGTNNGGS